MRILMFGRGVIATLYGWALAGAGHHVEFYVRPGRASAYGDSVDLEILDSRRSGRGGLAEESWRPRYRESLSVGHGFDLIVVSVPHHRLPEAIEFLSPRIGTATVLMFSNMWEEPLRTVAPLPLDQLVWGFPQGGGGFDDEGVLRAALLPSVLFGRFHRELTPRETAVRTAFRQAGLRPHEQSDFRGWLLLHTIVDASLYSQALQCGALAGLAGDTAGLRQAMLVGRELLPLATARGVDLRKHPLTALQLRSPSWLPAMMLSTATRHIPAARRSFEAHADPDAEEPRAVCRDVLAEADRLGIAVPRLSAAMSRFIRPVDDAV